jgi:signal peptidase II
LGFFFLLGLDVLSKFLAIRYLQPAGSIALSGDFFRLSYVENTGAAFGGFHGKNDLLLVISLFVAGILVLAMRYARNRTEIHAYVLILAGAAGNAVDRFFRGYVVDFLDFDFFDIRLDTPSFLPNIHLERWPVFNLADTFICVGAFLVVVSLFLPITKKR